MKPATRALLIIRAALDQLAERGISPERCTALVGHDVLMELHNGFGVPPGLPVEAFGVPVDLDPSLAPRQIQVRADR